MTNLELGDRLEIDGRRCRRQCCVAMVDERRPESVPESGAPRKGLFLEASCYYAVVGTRYCVSTAEGHLAAGWLRRIPKPGMLVERLHAAKPACNDVGCDMYVAVSMWSALAHACPSSCWVARMRSSRPHAARRRPARRPPCAKQRIVIVKRKRATSGSVP